MIGRTILVSIVASSLLWSGGVHGGDAIALAAAARVLSFFEGLGGLTTVTIKSKGGVEYATLDDRSGLIHDCVVPIDDAACHFALLVRCARPGEGVLYEIDFTKMTARYDINPGTGPFSTDVTIRAKKDALKRNGVSIPVRLSTRGPVEMPALLEWLDLLRKTCPPSQ